MFPRHSITLKTITLMTVSIDIDGIALLVTAYHYSIANQGRRFFLMRAALPVAFVDARPRPVVFARVYELRPSTPLPSIGRTSAERSARPD